ncbi:MAG: hypothetical protein AAFP13_11025 [Pseudomonadota bacterium]
MAVDQIWSEFAEGMNNVPLLKASDWKSEAGSCIVELRRSFPGFCDAGNTTLFETITLDLSELQGVSHLSHDGTTVAIFRFKKRPSDRMMEAFAIVRGEPDRKMEEKLSLEERNASAIEYLRTNGIRSMKISDACTDRNLLGIGGDAEIEILVNSASFRALENHISRLISEC